MAEEHELSAENEALVNELSRQLGLTVLYYSWGGSETRLNLLLNAARSEGPQPPVVEVGEADLEWARNTIELRRKVSYEAKSDAALMFNARVDRILSLLGSRHDQ